MARIEGVGVKNAKEISDAKSAFWVGFKWLVTHWSGRQGVTLYDGKHPFLVSVWSLIAPQMSPKLCPIAVPCKPMLTYGIV